MNKDLIFENCKKAIRNGLYKTAEERVYALDLFSRFGLTRAITADQYQELAVMLAQDEDSGNGDPQPQEPDSSGSGEESGA